MFPHFFVVGQFNSSAIDKDSQLWHIKVCLNGQAKKQRRKLLTLI
jgi:hypothetical protein